MLPKTEKLKAKCEELGLSVTQQGNKLSKSDYVRALREHYMPPGGVPYTEVTPMQCYAGQNLPAEDMEAMWESDEWVVQGKVNGVRLILHFVEGVGVFAQSRTISVKTFRYQDLTEQLLIKDFIPDFSATVDCEAMISKPIDTRDYTAVGEIIESSLHSTVSVLQLNPENARKVQEEQNAPIVFHVFDVLGFGTGGEYANSTDLEFRYRIGDIQQLEEIIRRSKISEYFEFLDIVYHNKKVFYYSVVNEGGEGVILKHLRSPYIASSSRKRDGWVKVKRKLEYDAFVSGFKRGEKGTAWENLVGALEFSVFTEKGKKHVIGYVSGIPLEERERMTQYDPESDTLRLSYGYYNRVAEIRGQDLSSRELRLTHCAINRWRPASGPDSKSPDECLADIDFQKTAQKHCGASVS